MIRRLLCLAIPILFCFASLAMSQAPAPAPAAGPLPMITREDLAIAYLRVERAFHAVELSPRRRAAAHRTMDEAAYRFFTGNHSGAIQKMNELADALLAPQADAGDEAALDAPPRDDWRSIMRSMRVRVAPRIANVHRPSIFNARISRLYTVPIEQPLDLRLVVREDRDGGKTVFEKPIQIRGDAPLPSISAMQPDASPGAYRVELIGPNGGALDVGRWYVVDQSLDVLRAANERQLAGVEVTTFETFQALVACRSRNALLTDRPLEGESAQFLANPFELSRQVQAEVEALRKGDDPYRGRAGDYWRAVPAGAMNIPSRVYAPQQHLKPDHPLPLVIALHGAGADENAYLDAHGAGLLKRLADEHGFIVVAPSTYWVMPNPSALKGIVETMSATYAIDSRRVYLVGHSLGAMAAAGIATRQPENVAAAVLVAGGKFPPTAAICPTLIIAAELDGIAPPHHLERVAAEAKEQGSPVEFRLARDAGHLLIAGEALPEAIEFLLKHRSAEPR